MPSPVEARLTRTFIALPVGQSLIARLVELQEELKRSGEKVKWVEPEHFHITLKFLGDTDESLIPDISASLADCLSRWESFRIELEGVGAFPKASRPQTLWAGSRSGHEETSRLAREIDRITYSYGFPEENRPFRTHVTLGRVKSEGRAGRLGEAIQRLKTAPVGSFEADKIIFYRSDLSPAGPRYSALATVDLAPNSGEG